MSPDNHWVPGARAADFNDANVTAALPEVPVRGRIPTVGRRAPRDGDRRRAWRDIARTDEAQDDSTALARHRAVARDQHVRAHVRQVTRGGPRLPLQRRARAASTRTSAGTRSSLTTSGYSAAQL